MPPTPATAPPRQPDGGLDAADFEFMRRFLKAEAAIALEAGKEYLVTSRLTPLLRRHGLDGLPALIDQVRRNPRTPLAAEVVDAMTTNETSFFRDGHPFDSLRDHVLPDLLQARAVQRRLRIWCAAASSGQEPYSIALVLREHFPQLAGWQVEILATDLSATMLAKGRAAEYSQLEVNRGMPAAMLVRHFHRQGVRWVLDDDVRRTVTWRQLNLAGTWPAAGPFDVVFMRNVLIYFDAPTKARILRQTRQRTADDGYLILGGAETTIGVADHFRRTLLGRSVWYRAA